MTYVPKHGLKMVAPMHLDGVEMDFKISVQDSLCIECTCFSPENKDLKYVLTGDESWDNSW